jgi:hypothetical protein
MTFWINGWEYFGNKRGLRTGADDGGGRGHLPEKP